MKKATSLYCFIFLCFCAICIIGSNYLRAKKPHHIAYDAFGTDANSVKTAVAENTDFAFGLYNKLKNDPDATAPKGNLFLSPYSISTALGMTYGGARGETQRQMASALNFTLPEQKLYCAFGWLGKQLIRKDRSCGYQLLTANALWGQKDVPFLRKFLDINEHYYGAGLRQLDFFNETEQSRLTINHWVEKKTNNKIKDLIPPDGIDRETAMVLTNAIYFKNEWKNKFSPWATEKADFITSAKDKTKVRMMYLSEGFRYYEDEKLQLLELPYKGEQISMLVILPKKIDGIGEIENILTVESLNILLSKMRTTGVNVYLPRFKITWGTFSLKNSLKQLGMKDAFEEGKADFSGMNGKKDLFISEVFHKAFIEVNEEGTEAAAATAAAFDKAASLTPLVFRADHPFVFIIRDNHSGSILFMGRLMNPIE